MNQARVNVVFAFLFVFICLALTANAQSRRVTPSPTPTPPDDDAVRINTEEIKLNVLAFNEQGQFVGDVQADDVVITENDVLHQATSLRRIPANVLIVMDTGGEMRQVKSLDRTRNAARAVVEALRPGDSIALLQYADKARIVTEWTTDKQQIFRAIGRTDFGTRSAYVDALELARDFLMKNPADNRHMVLITDGTDSSASTQEKLAAMRDILETDISVHVLSYTQMEAADIEPRTDTVTNRPPPKAMPDEVAAQLPNGVRDIATAPKAKTINLDRTLIRKLKAREADLKASEQQLVSLAEGSNGTAVVPGTIDEMIDKAPLVARMIDSSYVVTYIPKVPLNEQTGERNIEVTSKRDGLIVQARRKIVVDDGSK